MKLYAFDEVDDRLELVPLAARRALDRAGIKLSRAGWLSLPLDDRRALSDAGAETSVNVEQVRALVSKASPSGQEVAPAEDPGAEAPPEPVKRAFTLERAISPALWQSLSPLDRFALHKVAERSRPERMTAAWNEIIGASAVSTHLAPGGGARMVDVGPKAPSLRSAIAESSVTMSEEAFRRLADASAAKGDVLGTARLAGIMAAKRTADLIPLCHPLQLTHVQVDLALAPDARRVMIKSMVQTFDRTGVEMEALVAASVAALTVYDMLKAYDRGMEIGPARLLAKSGGRSGDYRAKENR